MLLCAGPAPAHVPEEAEVTLRQISVCEEGIITGIRYEDVRDYSRTATGKRESFDVPLAFRAAQVGMGEIWGNDIPHREDVAITGGPPTYASALVMRYITGTGENMTGVKSPGEYKLVLRDGREVGDITFEKMQLLSRDMTAADYTFDVARLSTGESFTVTLREGVVPDRYFELAALVNRGHPRQATPEELEEFIILGRELKEQFLNSPDQELFAVKGPFPFKTALASAFALVIVVGLVDFWRNGYKRWKQT